MWGDKRKIMKPKTTAELIRHHRDRAALTKAESAARVKAAAQATLTQGELAERAGMSQSNLSQYERGQKNPTVATLERLADALGVDVADLIRVRPS